MRRDFNLESSPLDVAEGVAGGEFDGIGNQREGGQNVREVVFAQAVEMRRQTVQFRAQLGTLRGVSCTVFVRSQTRRTRNHHLKARDEYSVAEREADKGRKIEITRHSLTDRVINHEAIENGA